MNFKDWMISELDNAFGGTTQPTSMTPTKDQQVFNKTVQTTLQDPNVAPVVQQASSNNQSAAFKGALSLAQKSIRSNQTSTAGANPLAVNALDVAKGVMKQISSPGPTGTGPTRMV